MSANPVVLGLTASGELLIQGIVQDQGISSETIHHVGSKSRFEAESWSGEHEERQHQEDRRYSLVHDNEAAKGQDEDTPIASSEHFERKRTPSLAAALLEIDPQGVPLIHFFHPTSDTPLLEAEEEAVEIEDAGESEKVISSLLFLLREMKMKEPEKYTIAVQRLRELEAELRTAGAVTPADPAVSDAVARALAASGPGRDIQIRVNQSRHTTTTKTVYETETPGMAGLDPEKIRELHQQMLASISEHFFPFRVANSTYGSS